MLRFTRNLVLSPHKIRLFVKKKTSNHSGSSPTLRYDARGHRKKYAKFGGPSSAKPTITFYENEYFSGIVNIFSAASSHEE